jgi:hypothetical protein
MRRNKGSLPALAPTPSAELRYYYEQCLVLGSPSFHRYQPKVGKKTTQDTSSVTRSSQYVTSIPRTDHRNVTKFSTFSGLCFKLLMIKKNLLSFSFNFQKHRRKQTLH